MLPQKGIDRYVPSTLAQALYLLPDKKREGYAFLLDVGFLTSSISVVYGNGIVHEESFNCGVGTVLISLMQHFDVEYDVAEEILATANISSGNVPKGMMWLSETIEKQISVQEINDCIKFSLDELCENVYQDHRSADGFRVIAVNVFLRSASRHGGPQCSDGYPCRRCDFKNAWQKSSRMEALRYDGRRVCGLCRGYRRTSYRYFVRF